MAGWSNIRLLTGSSVSVSVSPAHITPGVVLIGLSRTRGVLVDANRNIRLRKPWESLVWLPMRGEV